LPELKDRMAVSHETDSVCRALANLAEEYEVKCVVQVGAEDGFEAWYIHNQIGCRAVAIDPDPKVTSCSESIELYRCAIGAETRPVDFWCHEQMGLSSTLKRNDSMEQHLMVEQYTLDDFCTMQGVVPDMLIIDTEGTALDVLRGATETLKGVRVIYAEVQIKEFRPGVSLLGDVDACLMAHGFVIRHGPPSYDAGVQGNFTWVRDDPQPNAA
jgi:FkbM family methyltransferase